ncbi:hypothetical protein [Roseiterribacter gracilis]
MRDYLPFIIIAVVIAIRFSRRNTPQRLRPAFLVLWPVLILLAVAFFIFGFYMTGAAFTAGVAAAVVIGLALGTVAGWYRARSILLHRDPDTGHIMSRATIEGLLVIGVLFVVRFGLRKLDGGNQFGVFTDGCMAFVVGLLFTRSYVMWRRCKALPPHQPLQTA